MPEIVTYKDNLYAVYVDSYGEISLQDVETSLESVITLLQKSKAERLIVDVKKQVEALPFLDAFTICKDLLNQLPPNLKIAYIVTNPPKQSQAFFTLMANTLGYPIEVFYSIEMAKEWFEGKHDPNSNPLIGPVKFPSLSD